MIFLGITKKQTRKLQSKGQYKNHFHYLHRTQQCFLYLKRNTYQCFEKPSKILLHPVILSLSKNIFFLKTPFESPLKNWRLYPKVCGEMTWLPIYKMVWHLTISSAVWMLELSKMSCKDFFLLLHPIKHHFKHHSESMW